MGLREGEWDSSSCFLHICLQLDLSKRPYSGFPLKFAEEWPSLHCLWGMIFSWYLAVTFKEEQKLSKEDLKKLVTGGKKCSLSKDRESGGGQVGKWCWCEADVWAMMEFQWTTSQGLLTHKKVECPKGKQWSQNDCIPLWYVRHVSDCTSL